MPQMGQGDGEGPGAIPAPRRAVRVAHLICPWPAVSVPRLCCGYVALRCAALGSGSQQLAGAGRGRGGHSHSPGAARPRLIRQRQLQAEAQGPPLEFIRPGGIPPLARAVQM